MSTFLIVFLLFIIALLLLGQAQQVFKDPKIPLVIVEVQGEFIDFVGKVNLTQKYKNNYNHSIESIYQFNLDDASTVVAMTMILGNRRLSSLIKEKDQARREYQQAIQEKKTTGLLEKYSNGIYRINVGNIAPQEEISIEIIYITTLPCSNDGRMHFILPTNIGLKYDGSADKTSEDCNNIQETLSQLVYSSSPASFSFYLQLDWTSNYLIQDVVSFTNQLHVSPLNQKKVHIESTATSARGDFSVTVRTKEIGPTLYVRQEAEDTYLMVNHRILDEVDRQAVQRAREYIIMIDRSGSMENPLSHYSSSSQHRPLSAKIDFAREVGLLFVKSLPKGSKFNVFSYGSSHSTLFPASVPNTRSNVAKALEAMKGFEADFGGTELYAALESLIKSSSRWTERLVLLITDAEVSNTDAIWTLLRHSKAHRIFTVGIGQDVNRFLCREISRVSNAFHEILVDHGNVSEVVEEVLGAATKTFYYHPELLLGSQERLPLDLNLFSHSFAQLFHKLPTTLWKTLPSLEIKATHGLTGAEKRWVLSLPKDRTERSTKQQESYSLLIKQFYAIDRVQRLEQLSHERSNRQSLKNLTEEIVRLSVDYQVMSLRTSFLVIDEEVRGHDNVSELPLTVQVPQFNNFNLHRAAVKTTSSSSSFSSMKHVRIPLLGATEGGFSKQAAGLADLRLGLHSSTSSSASVSVLAEDKDDDEDKGSSVSIWAIVMIVMSLGLLFLVYRKYGRALSLGEGTKVV